MNQRNFLLSLLMISGLSLSAQEHHLRNIQKLTFGGDNAEAYFSPDSKKLSLQVTKPQLGAHCDQIYLLDLARSKGNVQDLNLISTGKGRTTCSFFMPDGK